MFGPAQGLGPLGTIIHNLQDEGILPSTGPIGKLLDNLENLGVPGGPTAQTALVEVSHDAQPVLVPDAQIAEFSSTKFTVDTSGSDSIQVIIGTGLNDLITLTGNKNVLLGTGEGHDTLTDASSSNNEILGGAGADTIVHSGTGSDSILGGAGNDLIDHHMGAGADTLIGGAGNDTILGGDKSDSILGGGGADLLVTGTGINQTLMGGAGNDTIEWSANSGSGDSIDGGGGKNTLVIDRTDPHSTTTHGGVTTITFTNPDNTTTTLSYQHIATVKFTDSSGNT